MKILDFFYKYFLLILAIIILLVSFVPRYYGNITCFEHGMAEVPNVGYAISFLQGDLSANWHQYGHLYSYILSVIYAIISFCLSMDVDTFVQDFFLNPSFYYLVARIFNTVLIITSAILLYFFARDIYDKKVATVAFILGIFPFIDNIASFLAKNDVLVALWSLLTVYYTVKFYQTKKTKHYVITGIFLGLGVATKPILGLLVLPTIFLSCFLSKAENNFFVRLKNLFLNKKLFLLIICGVFSNFLFNPYSLIDFRNYIDEQIMIAKNEIYLPWSKGYSYIFDFSNEYYLGLFFVLVAIISVFYFLYKYFKNKKKEAIYFIIASYPLIYFGVFAFLPIFEHILIPIIPVLILMISKFIVDISDNIRNRWLRIVFLLFIIFCLLFQPGRYLFKKYLALKDYKNIENKASTIAGEEWVQNNIPNNSKIFIYGHMLDTPRIVDYRVEKQMELLMYSMYRLDDKPLFFESYRKVHDKIKDKKNTYHIEEMRYDNDNIFDYVIRNDFDYVISDYSKNLDVYPELKKRKIIHFDSFDYLTGGSFSIYKMKLE